MQRSREREARLHKLQEHVKVSAPWCLVFVACAMQLTPWALCVAQVLFDESPKKQIFANEPIPGQPAIEFIHSYTMVRPPSLLCWPCVRVGAFDSSFFSHRIPT